MPVAARPCGEPAGVRCVPRPDHEDTARTFRDGEPAYFFGTRSGQGGHLMNSPMVASGGLASSQMISSSTPARSAEPASASDDPLTPMSCNQSIYLRTS
jgi:hypothetical protein